MKKILITVLGFCTLMLTHGQNYINGNIGVFGSQYNPATTITGSGFVETGSGGNWFFAGVISAGVSSGIRFTGTGTYSNASAVTGYVDGNVGRTGSIADFTFPTGDASATVGGVYHPISFTAITGATNTSLYYSGHAGTGNTANLGAGVGSVDPLANWPTNLNASTAGTATITLATRNETGVFAGPIFVVGYNTTTSKWESLGAAAAIVSGGQNLVSNTGVDLTKYSVFTVGSASALGVTLNLTVYLEGDMAASGNIMRNDLQQYLAVNGVALLPTTDPYGGGATYAAINNPAGVVGNVVDWVSVEVRSASNSYSTVLQSMSLLLKTDGTIVTPTGAVPIFNAQTGIVRVDVIHRNHLAIQSQDITTFSGGLVSYDFSTAIGKAFNSGGDPAQMKLKNGVWCMITGDVNRDYAVDNSDASIFNSAFNAGTFDAYVPSDLNMDGVVDNSDASYFNTNFNVGYFSTMINY